MVSYANFRIVQKNDVKERNVLRKHSFCAAAKAANVYST